MSTAITEKLQFAKDIAVQLGKLAYTLRHESAPDNFISAKGMRDFVTTADLKVETLFRQSVSEKYPEDNVLGEEEGLDSPDSDSCWVIDPIDGTINYMKGNPDWSVSIAYVENHEIVIGVIYIPETQQLLWASKGQGSYCNDKPIQVSGCDELSQSSIMFSRSERWPLADYLQTITRIDQLGMFPRVNGTATISLLRVAMGQAECYFEKNVASWDVCAGLLIISEAGGVIQHPKIADFMLSPGDVLASNGKIPTSDFT